MNYIKATIVGLMSGLLLAILWVVTALWFPVYVEMFLSSMRNEGSGGIGASVVGSGSTALAVLVGFVAGVWWTVRRARKQFSN